MLTVPSMSLIQRAFEEGYAVPSFCCWNAEFACTILGVGRRLNAPVLLMSGPGEFPVWVRYPHMHFEYLCAHELLYNEMANAAKQVGNVSVGPWWHYFRRHKIARMVRDQLSMGPIASIVCGFTDARFVEMIAVKYRSLRLGVADALAELVSDPHSHLHHDLEAAGEVMRELLLINPARVHHIPIELDEPRQSFAFPCSECETASSFGINRQTSTPPRSCR